MSYSFVRRRPALCAGAAVGAVAALAVGVAVAPAGASSSIAHPDSYRVRSGQTLTVDNATKDGVLGNDGSRFHTVVAHTTTAHGTLDLHDDGTFTYTPAPGFSGTDTFNYTTQDAVTLYKTHLPPLATIGNVAITGGAYGSSFTAVPGTTDEFYGLTDRGPNVDGPSGSKVEPIPSFVPAIGRFHLVDGQAKLIKSIPLHATDGTPYNGQVNCAASTGETIYDLAGKTLPCTDTGYDPEGLVALADGTFWVSDEYGPFITHFDAAGKQIGRLSPFDHSLPRELAFRLANRGMEGLTVTPDGRTLVGIMQSALQAPDLTATGPKNVSPVRIVTIDLKTFEEHEYLYLLQDPATTGTAVSEIAATDATHFVVDERDGKFEPNAVKKFYSITLDGATDIGPAATVANTTYDPAKGGRLVGPNHTSIEAFVGKSTTAAATTALAGVGITPVTKTLDLDLGALTTKLDPTGGFFGHDKIEGIASLRKGRTLVISNDNDFGIDGLTNSTPPFTLHAKTLPNGQQDDGEYLSVDLSRVDDAPTSTTVTILVTPPKKTASS